MLGRLEQLTANRRTLAGAPRQLIALFGQTLRAVGIVVLLATIYLPVLLVPLLALAPALSDRWAARVQRRADDALAEDRRLLDALFSLATGADSARELRTYGITGELARRHAALGERVRRRSVRAAVLSSALEAIGWAVFAAGPGRSDRRPRAARHAGPRQPRPGGDGGLAAAPRPEPDLALHRHRRQLQHRGRHGRAAPVAGGPRNAVAPRAGAAGRRPGAAAHGPPPGGCRVRLPGVRRTGARPHRPRPAGRAAPSRS